MTHHVAELAFCRGVLWAVLLYVAIRHRSKLSICAVLLAWTSNFLLANSLLVESGFVGIVSAALIVYLLIDRLAHRPEHIEHVLTAQLHDARRELHGSQSDRASWEARAVAYRRLLEQHNITH